MNKRVVVTGIGVISPIGNGIEEAFRNACAGRSGIGLLPAPAASRLHAPLAAAARFDGAAYFSPPRLRMLDRVTQFAVAATRQAFDAARLDLAGAPTGRIGVFIGTGMGGTATTDDGYLTLYGEQSDRIKPFTVMMGMYNAPAAWIGIDHGLRGPNLTYSTACAASAVAIGEAWLRIARGELDIAIAGGTEAPLCLGALKAWEALHALASVDRDRPSASCKPFSRDRSGMVLAEGAAILILEERSHAQARGAPVFGELLGYGLATDIGHITRPSVDGQAAAMRAALVSAGIDVHDVDAINAHGTGTAANDVTETAAVRAVFGKRAEAIPISATKAVHGHLLGAAGALECALSLRAMQEEIALPTMHLQHADPECDLDYVPNMMRTDCPARIMLSNSFAFGGTNAVLVLGRGTG